MDNEGLSIKSSEKDTGFQSPSIGKSPLIDIPLENLALNKPTKDGGDIAADGLDITDRDISDHKGLGSRRQSVVTVVEEEFKGDSIFSRRMTIAGGFLDIALFSSNSEQLKSLLEIGYYHDYYEFSLGLLITSMILQVLAGFTLFMVGCVTIKSPEAQRKADIMNHITMGLVALITVVNIFISSFSIKGDVLQKCMRGEITRY